MPTKKMEIRILHHGDRQPKYVSLGIVTCIADTSTEFSLALNVPNDVIKESDEDNYLSSCINTGRDEITAEPQQEESLSK